MRNRRSFSQVLVASLVAFGSVFAALGIGSNSNASAQQSPALVLGEGAQSNIGLDTAPASRIALPTSLRNALAADSTNQQDAYSEYMRVSDDNEFITMRIPAAWDDVESGLWSPNGNQELGVYLVAAPDLEAFTSSQGPGVFFAVSRELAVGQKVSNPAKEINPAILNLLSFEGSKRASCNQEGRYGYDDKFYKGLYDVYLNCGADNDIILATMPAHQEFITLVHVAVETEADMNAASEIFASYQVLNPGLVDHHHDDGHAHEH